MNIIKCPDCKRERKVKENSILVICPCGEFIELKEKGEEGWRSL